MGEVSFKYFAKPYPRYIAQFRYNFMNSIEYSFAYRRYIALSDASILNSPVAITKVATGLSELYQLFVDKQTHNMIYKDIAGLFKVEYDVFQDDTTSSIHKKSKDLKYEDISEWLFKPFPFNAKYGNKLLTMHRYLYLQYFDFEMLKRDNNSNLSYSSTIYFAERVNHFKINEENTFGSTHDKISNVYEQELFKRPVSELNIYGYISGERPTIGLNIYNNISGKPFDNIANIYSHASLCPPQFHKDVNLLPFLFGRKRKYEAFVNNIYAGAPYSKYITINSLLSFGLPNKKAEMNSYVSVETYQKYMNLQDIISAFTDEKKININDILSSSFSDKTVLYEYYKLLAITTNKKAYVRNIDSGKIINKKAYAQKILFGKSFGKSFAIQNILAGDYIQKFGNVFNYTNGIKLDIESSINSNIILESNNDKIVHVENIYNVTNFEKPGCIFDLDTFAITESKSAFIIDNIVMNGDAKIVQQSDNIYWLIKDKLQSSINSNIFISGNEKNIYTNCTFIFTSKDNKSISLDKYSYSLIKNDKVMNKNKYDLFIDKNGKQLSVFSDYTSFVKDRLGIWISDGLSLYKGKKDIPSINTISSNGILISSNKKSFELKDTIISVESSKKSFEIKDTYTDLFKYKKSMMFYDQCLDAYKDAYSMTIIGTEEESVFKSSNSFVVYKYFTDLWKDAYEFRIHDDLFLDTTNRSFVIFQNGQNLVKSLLKTDIVSDMSEVIKNYIPFDFVNELLKDHTGMIIPLAKTRVQSYIDDINTMLHKISYNGFINTDTSGSVISKNAIIEDALSLDKKNYKALVEYKNYSIAKQKVHAIIHQGFLMNKDIAHASLDAHIWIKKDLGNSWITPMVTMLKNEIRGYIDTDTIVTKDLKKLDEQYDQLFIDKDEKICYYDYDTWMDKEQIKASLNIQYEISKNENKTHLIDITNATKKDLYDGFYEKTIVLNKSLSYSDLANQLEEIHRLAYDADVSPNDFGNWVWVYEAPDPFEDPYGIDELLLPENDTRYENFEDIIFDKENMKPRSPVKVIDDTTFIARYPIKYPIDKYKDIAKNYDDSAIKNAQYYGVETSVMKAVFLKYYQIWQSKIYEFSTMTMKQSVTKMLDYIYAWIMVYFPANELEQALRVLKLIRWYSETAIIQNSQYVISYEYGLLESKLHTGTCAIPNNLSLIPGGNNTMFVDSSLGVIRNNPSLIGIDDAYVEFYIDNKKNTTFSFSLSNTVGSVNIYINDVLVDTISKSGLNYIYELPYTGDTNTVKIIKPTAHNLNQYFYIGYIRIPNATYKNLSIEYDSTLKAGNKPLNQIAKKMMAAANLYDNPEEMYDIIKKGNVGITETYKLMNEYWQNHHQGKTKGKRLTIKQV